MNAPWRCIFLIRGDVFFDTAMMYNSSIKDCLSKTLKDGLGSWVFALAAYSPSDELRIVSASGSGFTI
jgi:hypothetical protein